MATRKKETVNAIDLLTDDHEKVRKMFKKFEKIHEDATPEEKQELVEQICEELTLHTTAEEEIFYPAAREAIDDDDLLNEAEVEHASAKDLIEQIQSMDVSDPMYDAKVTVLGEYVDHHVKEEEKEMFPKAKKAKLDLETLGEQIMAMKEANGAMPAPAARAKSSKSTRSSARR